MKTFLIIILVLSLLNYASKLWKLRTTAACQKYLLDSENKIKAYIENTEFSEKTKNILWWVMLGIYAAFEIAIYVMLFYVLAHFVA